MKACAVNIYMWLFNLCSLSVVSFGTIRPHGFAPRFRSQDAQWAFKPFFQVDFLVRTVFERPFFYSRWSPPCPYVMSPGTRCVLLFCRSLSCPCVMSPDVYASSAGSSRDVTTVLTILCSSTRARYSRWRIVTTIGCVSSFKIHNTEVRRWIHSFHQRAYSKKRWPKHDKKHMCT